MANERDGCLTPVAAHNMNLYGEDRHTDFIIPYFERTEYKYDDSVGLLLRCS